MARCVRVIDLGTQPGSQMYPQAKHKVLFFWELPGELVQTDDGEMPQVVVKRYTLSLHEKAGLRHDLQSWRGKQFTHDELQGFALKKVLGAPCMVTVVHSPDGKYANLNAVTACPKGMDVPAAKNPLVYYEIEDGASETFGGFSDKLQETIRNAPEWKGPADPDQAPQGDGFNDDDIPF